MEEVLANVPVTVLGLHGDLDASNYQELIETARRAQSQGARFLLLDMSETPYMSSAGLVGLHSVAMLMRGQQPPDPESGWEAFHSIKRDLDSGFQEYVKLLNPQERVRKTLEKSGMVRFFEVFSDRDTALASF
jgi:anti-anti-sigma regulatory factor